MFFGFTAINSWTVMIISSINNAMTDRSTRKFLQWRYGSYNADTTFKSSLPLLQGDFHF